MADSAEDRNEEGRGHLDARRLDEARGCFEEAARLAPDWPVPLYNLGLVYKLKKDWPESLKANLAAHRLDPTDVATYWNMTIAACALSDWKVAEIGFRAIGLSVPETPPPWDLRLGMTPIRLDPDHQAEVVWADRLDPSRARLMNVPLPESGFGYRDIVLHDAEPMGYREFRGRQFPVFNCLELLERSEYRTLDLEVEADSQQELDSGLAVLEEHGACVEDWTASIRMICRACSEGRPHDHHDEDLEESWPAVHRWGVALPEPLELAEVMSVSRLRWSPGS
jgi:tetratricopeptide (TPR) repeat protein